ncbi:MAG: ketopantoate reductase family protein [Candidatus Hodarchaeales archaeon]|jgi:2-dehydropantoate 2-reductase
MRVVVIGVGAVGGPIAVNLADKNLDLTVVTKHRSLAEKIQNKGLYLQSMEETKLVKINAVPLVTDLKGKYDIVFLTMKATGVMEAARSIIPYLAEDGVVVTLQNGIVEERVAKIVGRNRLIGGVVATTSKAEKPGEIQRTLEGAHYIGLIDKTGNHTRLQEVGKLLEHDMPAVITDNIYGALYAKLGINVAVNGLGAISGLTLGELLETSGVWRVYLELTTEVVQLARKLRIKLIQIGSIHLEELVINKEDSNEILKLKHKKLIDTLLPRLKDTKTSTLYSLEKGQPSEIDYLNGFVAKKGKELNISTPYNDKITELVKDIESGLRSISPMNLQELVNI